MKKPTMYRPVVVVTKDFEPNIPLTAPNPAVKNIPVEAVPAGALAATRAGKVVGQRLWPGEFLLPPVGKDNQAALPVSEHRVFSIPAQKGPRKQVEAGPARAGPCFLFTRSC